MLCFSSSNSVALGLALISVVGCTSVNYEIPTWFDLTGSWTLDKSASDVAPDLTKIRDSEQRAIVAGRNTNPVDSATFIVHDFPVVASDTISIEQDSESMGVKFEDAPYADYKWGRQMRNGWRIEVGWTEGSLVVSKARDSVRGSETYTLNREGNRLSVAVRVITSEDRVVLKRVYVRE